MFKVRKLEPGSVIHLARNSSPGRSMGWLTIYCTGRAMQWIVRVDDEVTCKACLKRASKAGIDAKEVA